MNTLKKLSLGVLFVTSFAAQSASVWKVTNGDNVVYFGGTIHVLKANNLPLPEEFNTAYKASEKLVFETDIEGAESQEFQQKMMSKVLLEKGETLQSRLSKDTYELLKNHLAERGIAITTLQSLKPSIVALTLTFMEFRKIGFTQKGVDQIYAAKAREDGKQIDCLESLDKQIEYLANLGGGDEDGLIKYTIEEMEGLPILVDKMLSSWLSGDLEELNETMIKDMESQYPDIYADLIVERNNNWMPKIIDMLNDKPTEFVLVGAGHFAGKDSVFAKLQAKGFKIEKVQ